MKKAFSKEKLNLTWNKQALFNKRCSLPLPAPHIKKWKILNWHLGKPPSSGR